jgi:hypothetical protein
MRITAKTIKKLGHHMEQVSDGRFTLTGAAGFYGTGDKWTLNLDNHVWLSADGHNRRAAPYLLGVIAAYEGEATGEIAEIREGLTSVPGFADWYERGKARGRHYIKHDAAHPAG